MVENWVSLVAVVLVDPPEKVEHEVAVVVGDQENRMEQVGIRDQMEVMETKEKKPKRSIVLVHQDSEARMVDRKRCR